jgi:thymidylate synthase (FAD)
MANIRLIACTPSLFPAYAAGKACRDAEIIHRSATSATEEEMAAWLTTHIIGAGHWGILEHICVTLMAGGISRTASHQLVRHRIASYAQLSGREGQGMYTVCPPSIRDNVAARAIFHTIDAHARSAYEELISLGMPAEDARFILPHGQATNLVMTFNGRAIIEAARKRLCGRAQWEIRALFTCIALALYEQGGPVGKLLAAQMGPPCQFGACPERVPCGHPEFVHAPVAGGNPCVTSS